MFLDADTDTGTFIGFVIDIAIELLTPIFPEKNLKVLGAGVIKDTKTFGNIIS
ncbi:hypothetical protein XIS1_1700063 [Xenorhabdus innexi]|uniref:Uncharacterized protein n=1 Tax=Xenorhabdus innexi TaxID=290109 RepID=A0A1N6MW20_9GAMM|nr:hypothetical protein XIS1_1700063 [Xenorhabdus innexi]